MLRLALSPTDDMHIDNLRVALFNYIISKQKNENLLVRIEDIDKEKNIAGKDQEILDLLALFGIEYSQVLHQSQNVRFHTAMALQLMHEQKAFSCFCSSEWIEKRRQEAKELKKPYRYDDACRDLPAELVIDNTNPFTVRIKRPDSLIVIDDLVKGEISFETDMIDSFIIMRKNKTPTYDFSCAIDDMLGDISIVIHNEDHLSNTPKQEYIRRSLGYEKKIEYVHLPVMRNNESEKTSKDDENTSIKWLLKEGFLPSAISNYLISIGNKTPSEIFNLSEAIKWFDIKNISNSPTRFNIEMLRLINREHLKNLDAKELSRYVGFADEEIGELAKIYLQEASTTKELRSKIKQIFEEKQIAQEFVQQAQLITEAMKGAPYFEQYNDFQNYFVKKLDLNKKSFSKIFRILLTGCESGPDIEDIYKYLKNYISEVIK